MGAISKISEKCMACPNVDKCSHKRMEACSYYEHRNMAESVAMPPFSAKRSIRLSMGRLWRFTRTRLKKHYISTCMMACVADLSMAHRVARYGENG